MFKNPDIYCDIIYGRPLKPTILSRKETKEVPTFSFYCSNSFFKQRKLQNSNKFCGHQQRSKFIGNLNFIDKFWRKCLNKFDDNSLGFDWKFKGENLEFIEIKNYPPPAKKWVNFNCCIVDQKI